MKKFLNTLSQCSLFRGFSQNELESIIGCLGTRVAKFEKNEFIFETEAQNLGILLSGEVRIISEDYWGHLNIMSRIEPGEIFGEALAFTSNASLPVSAVASEKSCIMIMDHQKILRPCPHICSHHSKLLENMIHILAEKNITLMQKVEHVTKHSTREKLLSYLSSQAQKSGSSSFTIPYNREELANYLSVDRSAMSNELCKMRDAGIIEFNRSSFVLKQEI